MASFSITITPFGNKLAILLRSIVVVSVEVIALDNVGEGTTLFSLPATVNWPLQLVGPVPIG